MACVIVAEMGYVMESTVYIRRVWLMENSHMQQPHSCVRPPLYRGGQPHGQNSEGLE